MVHGIVYDVTLDYASRESEEGTTTTVLKVEGTPTYLHGALHFASQIMDSPEHPLITSSYNSTNKQSLKRKVVAKATLDHALQE